MNEFVEKSDLMRLTCGSSIFDVTPLLFLLFAPDDPFPDVDVLAPAEVVLFLRESAPPPFLLAFPAFRFSFRVRWNSLPDLVPDWVVAEPGVVDLPGDNAPPPEVVFEALFPFLSCLSDFDILNRVLLIKSFFRSSSLLEPIASGTPQV